MPKQATRRSRYGSTSSVAPRCATSFCVAPDAQTEALYQRILHSRSSGENAIPTISTPSLRASSTRPAVDDKPSVAVLPLVAINGDSDLDGLLRWTDQ